MLLPLHTSQLIEPTLVSSFGHTEAAAAAAASHLTSSLLLLSNTPSGLDVVLQHPEASLAPLNVDSESWIRSLVWTDFRIAVAFFVLSPLLLLGWAIALRIPSNSGGELLDTRSPAAETVLRLLTGYWQASSLLLLTVLWNIGESNWGVLTGLVAQAMIVVSLVWWEDLNDEIETSQELIGRVYRIWKNIAVLAAAAGVVIQAPFQQHCLLQVSSLSQDPFCAPWLEPPQFAAGLVGMTRDFPTIELATAGCALYALVLVYYSLVAIPTIQRRGRAPRPQLMNVATPIGAWIALGFLDSQPEQESTPE